MSGAKNRSVYSELGLAKYNIKNSRYSQAKQPTTEQEASDRINLLRENIVLVETHLENTYEESFPSKILYDSWRIRSINFIASSKTEIEFLEKWLKLYVSHTSNKQANPANFGVNLTQVRKRITDDVTSCEKKVGSIIKEGMFSSLNPPSDYSQAKKRQETIGLIKLELQDKLASITNTWLSHKLRRGDLPLVKRPLIKLVSIIETENSFLKDYLKKNRVEEPKEERSGFGFYEPIFLALDRAVTQGFVLTAEETKVFYELKEYRQKKLNKSLV